MERFKRFVLALRLMALDITIDGQCRCLASEADPVTRFRIETARVKARRERTRLRMAYIATLQPGDVRRWTTA